MDAVCVEYYPEDVASYRARRLAIALALIYVWMFVALIIFWIWRNATGAFQRLTVPPYGSGILHLLLCVGVVLAYVVGIMIVPRHTTVGLREGALPSLLPLVLQTPHSQFMSSYAWSSRYVALVRSLSVTLADCWLDVRELTPGDRVTQEIAHAAATARCLVIFFSYEYLRSVNCTLELLTALRYRGSPQRTIILLEVLGGEAPQPEAPAAAKSPLTVLEATRVADILRRAVPGLIVAKGVPELLDILDQHCVRSVDREGTAAAIEWWARHGKARVNRVSRRVRVVPPVLHDQLRNYKAYVCSCIRRNRGDVAGGFALLSGDGSAVRWYRPFNSATMTMFAVIFVELVVYLHMFIYCFPDIIALVAGHVWFEGSCLPSSSFLYVTSLLPFFMVSLQYVINMRADAASLHDEILLPLNVAAHSGSMKSLMDGVDTSGRESPRTSRGGGASHFSFYDLLRAANESAMREAEERRKALALASRPSARGNSNGESFTVVFVTSDSPLEGFSIFASCVSDFLTNHAVGIATRTLKISALPVAARRLAIYVFLLDSAESVDAFYRQVHCAPSRLSEPWPTSQIIVLCHADVLRTKAIPAPPQRWRLDRTAPAILSRAPSIRISLNPVFKHDTPVEAASLMSVPSTPKAATPGRIVMRQASANASAPSSTGLSASQREAGSSPASAARERWRWAIKATVQALPRHLLATPANNAPVARNLPARGEDGTMSPHLRTALFEYLLILTGSKAGVDPSSPYHSLAEALLDSVGRKVGSVLEARRDQAAVAARRTSLVTAAETEGGGVSGAAAAVLIRDDSSSLRSEADDRVVSNPIHAMSRSQIALWRPLVGAGDSTSRGFGAVKARPR